MEIKLGKREYSSVLVNILFYKLSTPQTSRGRPWLIVHQPVKRLEIWGMVTSIQHQKERKLNCDAGREATAENRTTTHLEWALQLALIFSETAINRFIWISITETVSYFEHYGNISVSYKASSPLVNSLCLLTRNLSYGPLTNKRDRFHFIFGFNILSLRKVIYIDKFWVLIYS